VKKGNKNITVSGLKAMSYKENQKEEFSQSSEQRHNNLQINKKCVQTIRSLA